MIRITRKPAEEGARHMTLDDVHQFVAECEHAGIDGTVIVGATISLGSKLKNLSAEG